MNGIDNYLWHCEVLDHFNIKDVKEIHSLSDDTYAQLLESEFNHVCEDLHRSIDFNKWVKRNNLMRKKGIHEQRARI